MGWITDEGSITDVFERCCRVPRIFGVYPFLTTGSRIEVSKLLVVYDLVLAFTINAFDVIMATIQAPPETNRHSVAAFILHAQSIMTSITLTVSCIWILRRKDTIQEMLDELNKFENIIQPKNIQLCNRSLVGVLGFLTVLVILHFIVTPIHDPLIILVHIRFHLSSVMIFSNTAFFTRCARIIGTAYGTIASNLGSSTNIHSMKEIQKAVEHLVSASDALNIIFGPQMLFLTSTSFVLNTGNLYMAITSTSKTLTFISILWVVTFSQLMLHLIHSCNWTSGKAKQMDREFYRIVLADKQGELSEQVRMCLHFTNNRKIEFTACGFFTIDYALAGSMVASATTYLVILIQIGGH